MGKKDSKNCAQAESIEVTFKKMVSKLEALFKVQKENEAGYQKYRKNGGAAISGLEKHLGAKKIEKSPAPKSEKAASKPEPKASAKVEAPESTAKATPKKKSAKKSKNKG
jgi:hypothetical protein